MSKTNWYAYSSLCLQQAEEYALKLKKQGLTKEEIEKHVQGMTSIMFSSEFINKYVEGGI